MKLAAMLAWIQANPVLFSTLVWPLLTGILSTVYHRLDQSTRLHAFFAMCVAAGVNVPATLEWARRWLIKAPPSPPAPETIRDQVPMGAPTEKDPPATSYVRRRPRPQSIIDRVGVAIGLGWVLTACAGWWTPAHANDIKTLDDCILTKAATIAPSGLPTWEQAAFIAVECGAENGHAVLDLVTSADRAEQIRAGAAR